MAQVIFPGLTTLTVGPMTSSQTALPVASDVLAKLIIGLGSTGYTWLTLVDDLHTEVIKATLVAGIVVLTRNAVPYAFPTGSCLLWELTDESVKDRVCNPVCEISPACPCVVPSEGATAIPNGMRELAWEGTINFLGTSPLVITILAAPGWGTYTIGSNFVKFTGTPGVAGTYSVSAKATNACGTVTVTKSVVISPKATDSDDCPTSVSTCSGGRLLFTATCAFPPPDPQAPKVEQRRGARVTFSAHCGPCEIQGCADTIIDTPNTNCPDTVCTTDTAGVTTCITRVQPGFVCSVNSLTGIITCIKTPVPPVVVDPFPVIPVIPNPVTPPAITNNPAASCVVMSINSVNVISGVVGDYAGGGLVPVSVTLAQPAVAGTTVKYESWGNYTFQGIDPPTTSTDSITIGATTASSTVNISNVVQAGADSRTVWVNGAVRITVNVPGCEEFTHTMYNREAP